MVLVRMEEHVLITKTATHVYVLMALKAIHAAVNTRFLYIYCIVSIRQILGAWGGSEASFIWSWMHILTSLTH